MPAKISIKASSETILDGACAYHETALEIDPETNFLLPHVQEVIAKLAAANDKERHAHRAVTKARAKRDFADAALDRAVVNLDLALLSSVNKDRKAPGYLRYFPQGGVTPVVTAPIDTEIKLVGTILAQLAEAKDGSPEKAHLRDLKAAHEGLKTAQAGLTTAIQDHAVAYSFEMEARMSVARQVEINEGELMKKFGKGRRLNSYFFRREDDAGDESPAAAASDPAAS